MPIIEMTLPEGSLDGERLDGLVQDLSEAVRAWAEMSGDPRVAEAVWALVDERRPNRVYAGGRVSRPPRYLLRVTVAAGALDDERKAGLIADATGRVVAAVGGEDPDLAGRVWCHIVEVPDGNWGAAGLVWRLPDIARFAGIERLQ